MAKRNKKKSNKDGEIDVPYATTWCRSHALLPEESGVAGTLIALCSYSDIYGVCWPSQRNLARITGRGERTILRHLNWLETNGWITRSKRYRSDGSISSCLYMITEYRRYVKGFLLSRCAPKQASLYETDNDSFLDIALAGHPVIMSDTPCHDDGAEVTVKETYKSSTTRARKKSPVEPVESKNEDAPTRDKSTDTTPSAVTTPHVSTVRTHHEQYARQKSTEALKDLTGENETYESAQDLYYEVKRHKATFKALGTLRAHLIERDGDLTRAQWSGWLKRVAKSLKTHDDKTVAGWLANCVSSAIRYPERYYDRITETAPPPTSLNPNNAARNLNRNKRFTPGLPVRWSQDGALWEVDIALSSGLIRIEHDDGRMIDVHADELELMS